MLCCVKVLAISSSIFLFKGPPVTPKSIFIWVSGYTYGTGEAGQVTLFEGTIEYYRNTSGNVSLLGQAEAQPTLCDYLLNSTENSERYCNTLYAIFTSGETVFFGLSEGQEEIRHSILIRTTIF